MKPWRATRNREHTSDPTVPFGPGPRRASDYPTRGADASSTYISANGLTFFAIDWIGVAPRGVMVLGERGMPGGATVQATVADIKAWWRHVDDVAPGTVIPLSWTQPEQYAKGFRLFEGGAE